MPRAARVSWLMIAVAICSGVFQDRNVNAFTTRSYDLDVPGSKPIRIIEADPGWDLNTRKPPPVFNRNERDRNERDRHDRLPQSLDSLKSNYKPFTHRGDKDDRFKHRPDFEHRTLKPDVISDRNDGLPSGSSEEEDNSEKLKKFLNSYAQNIHKKINVQINNPNLSHDDDELNLDDKFVDITTDSDDNEENKPEKSKSWNLLHFDKIQGAQDNKKWVSMEAVPWSVSKISKWHGKPKKDKYQNQHNGYYDQNDNVRPYNDRFHTNSQAEFPRPTYKPIRPNGVLVGQRPNGYFDNPLEEGDIEDPVDDDYYNRRPSFPRPSATYGHKVNLHTVHSYGTQGNVNKRPFKDNCNNNNNHNHHNAGSSFHGHVHDDGIITDGLPSNFPEHDYGNRRRGVSGDSSASASASHPFKGEVLPPLDDGRVNMTTSHGGLLQVDGTFQSVEEAQKQHAKRQKLKVRAQRRPLKVRPQLEPLDSTIGYATKPQTLKQKVQYQIQNGDSVVAASAPSSSVSDSSAVLAAVGAGMIPAGMALLVPMAMSGKRRRRQVQFSKYMPVNPYSDELTLSSSM